MKHLLLTTIAAVRLLLCGMATGALVGLLLSVVVQIPLGDNPKTALVMSHMSTALLTLVGIPLASAFSIRFGAKKLKLYEPRLLQLIPVAFLTLFIPVFGALMGTPNKINVPLITLLGAAGGAFWMMLVFAASGRKSADLLRKHGGKTGKELKAEGKLE